MRDSEKLPVLRPGAGLDRPEGRREAELVVLPLQPAGARRRRALCVGQWPRGQGILKRQNAEMVGRASAAAARNQDELGLRLVVLKVPPLRHGFAQLSDVDPVASFLDKKLRHIRVHLAGACPVLLCLVLQRRLVHETPVHITKRGWTAVLLGERGGGCVPCWLVHLPTSNAPQVPAPGAQRRLLRWWRSRRLTSHRVRLSTGPTCPRA